MVILIWMKMLYITHGVGVSFLGNRIFIWCSPLSPSTCGWRISTWIDHDSPRKSLVLDWTILEGISRSSSTLTFTIILALAIFAWSQTSSLPKLLTAFPMSEISHIRMKTDQHKPSLPIQVESPPIKASCFSKTMKISSYLCGLLFSKSSLSKQRQSSHMPDLADRGWPH